MKQVLLTGPARDLQWLLAIDDDNAYHSHDHGFFLTGSDWTIESLESRRNEPTPLTLVPDQLDRDELHRLAAALEALDRETIEQVLSTLPASWPVTDDELSAVAEFALIRKDAVAARVRSLVA